MQQKRENLLLLGLSREAFASIFRVIMHVSKHNAMRIIAAGHNSSGFGGVLLKFRPAPVVLLPFCFNTPEIQRRGMTGRKGYNTSEYQF